jgi:hypothetical protein
MALPPRHPYRPVRSSRPGVTMNPDITRHGTGPRMSEAVA